VALKAILFDLGGTLLHYHDPLEDDPRRPFRRVTLLGIEAVLMQLMQQQLASSHPAHLSIDQIRDVIDRRIGQTYLAMQSEQRGGNIEEPVWAALSEAGLAPDETGWSELRRHLYHPIEQTVSPRQGVRSTLAALRDAGYALGLISNTFWAADLHDRHLREHDLLDFLPIRIYSSSTPYQKPHPSIFLSALESMNIRPEEAAYVGDRADIDVGGAQNAGMLGILIRSPYQTIKMNTYHPDAIIDELPELIPALASLQSFPLRSGEGSRE
jgi:HAD superfamily hydrolase (TIGR01549 family)